MITTIHTKTYTLFDAWASTLPWNCLIRETSCVHPTHEHDPMVDDPCAVETCRKPLKEREECYVTTQLEGWVCWRQPSVRASRRESSPEYRPRR